MRGACLILIFAASALAQAASPKEPPGGRRFQQYFLVGLLAGAVPGFILALRRRARQAKPPSAVDPQMVDFIRAQLPGHGPEAVRRHLIEEGHSPALVDAAIRKATED